MIRVNGVTLGGGDLSVEAIVAAIAAPADAAQLLAALHGREVDDLTGAEWIAASTGGATATWATTPARLVLTVPPTTAGAVAVSRATFIPEGADEWDLLARVEVREGDASNQTRVALYAGQSAANCVAFQLWTDGTVELGKVIGGSYTGLGFGAASGLDAAARTGGQLWVRLSLARGRLFAKWGVGSAGELPTAWRTPRSTDDEAALWAACGSYAQIGAAALDTSLAAGLEVAVRAIRTVGQRAGAL